MKNIAFLVCLSLVLSLGHLRADAEIFHSDFDQRQNDCSGRPGPNRSAPKLAFDRDKHDVSTACTVTTDGSLGCGISYIPRVQVQVGGNYLLSFWVKASGSLPVTYRISREVGPTNRDDFGEDQRKWFMIPVPHGDWIKVERPFTASGTPVGFDFSAGEAGEPLTISIADIKILKFAD
jgi:hypothetical protein